MTPTEMQDKAMQKFSQGLHWSQAVLAVGEERLGIEDENLIKVMDSFGGGLAAHGEVCGAVIGGLAVIGLNFGRLKRAMVLGGGHRFSIPDLDVVVFAVPGILDYQAEVYLKEGKAHLRLKVHAETGGSQEAQGAVLEALRKTHFLGNALTEGLLVLEPVTADEGAWVNTGLSKRKIRDLRL